MKGKSKKPLIGICTFELTSDSNVQILPDGLFRADDGRPYDINGWRMNHEIASAVIARASARKRDTVIDYEHETMSGGKAIAAGWFHDLEYVAGQGLFITDARWTETAEGHIDKKEYRYISPVFTFDGDTGAVLRILHVAITNDPAIDGMEEIELAVAAKYFPTQTTEDETMNEELLKLLGLSETATEEDVVAACKALIDANTKHEADIIKFGEQVASLKAESDKAEKVDASKYVSVEVVEELKSELAALKSSANENEVNDIVELAMSEGKLLPAQEKWARDLGASDIAALKTYIDETPAIAALKGKQTKGKELDAEGNVVLGEADLAVCKQLGVTPEEYQATLKEEATA